ncbi:MAG: protein kinase [Paludibacter sp.]|nr:protein kinase [Paludibacter sp.]
MEKKEGDIISFLRQKDYVMVNPDLGHGSFGQAVVLQDPDLEELFVAKKYNPEFPEYQDAFFKSFKQEIKLLYRLNHKNIVRVFNYYLYENLHTGYILMEYIDGQSIESYLNDCMPMDENIFNGIFVQLIDAFQYMEENHIIHRDIREGNIMVDKNGTAKIIDFGLGKIFKPVEASPQDSMLDIINRSGLDALPEEYFSGSYDAQTDMFYLAELYQRLLRNANLLYTFAYQHILTRMMKEKRQDRFASFAEAKEAIGKKDFSSLNITEGGKKIYQAFANALYKTIVCFTEEPKFNEDISIFLKQIDGVLRNNCFEDIIQKNSDLLSCLIIGDYRYRPRIEISIDIVKNFRGWFANLDCNAQRLVFNNLSYKLSQVKTEIPDDDIPF